MILTDAPAEIDKQYVKHLVSTKMEQDSLSPVVFVENKLGLAYWCLSQLYAHSLLKYNQIKSLVGTRDKSVIEEIKRITRIMLLVNSDNYTIWGVRKKCIETLLELGENSLNILQEEIRLLNLINSKHPKSGESWEHRGWLLGKLFPTISEPDYIIDFCVEETRITERTCVLYSRCYYAWKHCIVLMQHVKSVNNKQLTRSWIQKELLRLEKWTRKNVSDHSSFHYLRYILEADLKDICDAEEAGHKLIRLTRQFHYCQFLILFFPGHESLWLYRRMLWGLLMDLSENVMLNGSSLSGVEEQVERSQQEFKLYEEEYQYKIPTLKNELVYAEQCANDSHMADFHKQRSYALAYQLYILESASKNMSLQSETNSLQQVLLTRDLTSGQSNVDLIQHKATHVLHLLKGNEQSAQVALWNQKIQLKI
ncbi:prenyltransferase alpha subunit repeat-containing protein [Acrasis kona]|uniref:Prenyltransferase alpha subunit repeat-containing protein n=1 Tax=Acrasis kona TaxID=1008807 RepID=A0AAW2ZQJ1_9EUKA